jgi:FkbM family methyltransferase
MPEHAIVGAAPMPSPSRLAGVLRNRRVPLRVRAGLAAVETRRRLRPRTSYPLRYGPGTVFLSHDDYAVDWESLKFVVVDHAYRTDYAGAVVLDLGAHKGYYGAYALAQGARTVVSFEPEAVNVELLERAAATYRANGADWRVRQAAVGAERGEAELHVMSASWGHALHPPDTFAEYEVGVQRVPVEAMRDILAEAGSVAEDGAPLVVKVNVEGEECGIVLGTAAADWQRVGELFVEMHPWAPCGPADLVEHVAAAGLREAPSAMAPVLRLGRTSRNPEP